MVIAARAQHSPALQVLDVTCQAPVKSQSALMLPEVPVGQEVVEVQELPSTVEPQPSAHAAVSMEATLGAPLQVPAACSGSHA